MATAGPARKINQRVLDLGDVGPVQGVAAGEIRHVRIGVQSREDMADDSRLEDLLKEHKDGVEEVAKAISNQDRISAVSGIVSLGVEFAFPAPGVRLLAKPVVERILTDPANRILDEQIATWEQEQDREKLVQQIVRAVEQIVATSSGHILNEVLRTLCEEVTVPLARVVTANQEIQSQRLSQFENLFRNIEAQLSNVGQPSGCTLQGESPPDLTVPSSPILSVRRARLVTVIGEQVEKATWSALHGATGVGKTELAKLIVSGRVGRIAWVRLRDTTPAQAVSRLQATAGLLGADLKTMDRGGWYRAAALCISSTGLLVLDDLPRVEDGDDLCEELLRITDAFARHGGKILSTSAHEPPQAILDQLPAGSLCAISASAFSNEEIEEFLALFQAPPQWCQAANIELLALATRRHPVLLAAAIRRLTAARWPDTSEASVLIGIGGDPNPATMRRLVRSVPDAQEREFLWRLSLAGRDLSFSDVVAIASVEPHIAEPRVRLANLTGVWLQQSSSDQYAISPLLSGAGETELAPTTRRSVARTLTELVLSRGSLGVGDVVAVVRYSSMADEPSRAAGILLWGLSAARRTNDKLSAQILLALTINPRPSDPYLITLETARVVVSRWLGNKCDSEEESLVALLGNASPEHSWAVVIAALMLATAPRRIALQPLTRILTRCLPSYAEAVLPNGSALAETIPVPLEELLWLLASDVRTVADGDAWLGLLASMNQERLEKAKRSEICPHGVSFVVDRVWLTESRKPKEEQAWKTIDGFLVRVGKVAQDLRLEILWAWALRARAIIFAEYLDRVDDSIAMLTRGLEQATTDPIVQFALRDVAGIQLIRADRTSEAEVMLKGALECKFSGFEILQTRCAVRLASVMADKPGAIRVLESAVQLAATTPELPASEQVRMLAELGLQHWHAFGAVSAFDAWDRAAELLLSDPGNDASVGWRGLFAKFAHVTGYLSSLAARGAAPCSTRDGEEYAAPRVRMFLDETEGLSDYYRRDRLPYLFGQMAMYAQAAQSDERTLYWAMPAIVMSETAADNSVTSFAALAVIEPLVFADRLGEVVGIAFKAAKATMASQTRHLAGRAVPENPTTAPPQTERDLRLQTEELALMLGVLPCSLRLARLSLQGDQGVALLAGAVQRECHRIAVDAEKPGMWKDTARLLDLMYVCSPAIPELTGQIKELAGKHGPTIHAIGYVWASVHPETTLEGAAFLQHWVFEYIAKKMGANPLMRRVLSSLLGAFWTRALAQQRYRFAAPSLVEEDLKTALQKPAMKQPEMVLAAVATGLRIRLRTGDARAQGSR